MVALALYLFVGMVAAFMVYLENVGDNVPTSPWEMLGVAAAWPLLMVIAVLSKRPE